MKKESLNEELNRMKKLMNFDISENSHDVLSENVIKTVNRIDEQMEEENLPSINFEKSFKNNMVFVDGNNSEVQNAINQLDGYIQKSKDDEKELKSIGITINAGASELRATNRLPEGVTKPDHDYGGIVPANMWTTVDKRVQSAAITQIPPSYNPNQGYYAIKDGNKYLAQKRVGFLVANTISIMYCSIFSSIYTSFTKSRARIIVSVFNTAFTVGNVLAKLCRIIIFSSSLLG